MNNPEDKKILGLIAAKFKTIRTEQGLSQRKLALIAKMEYNQVQKLEKGESNLQITTIVRLMEALNATPNDILPYGNELS
ncbi:helix-turn-helix domain-containing protein [Chitinophaga rhizosphaerae]|uniref:helix-turn-helix domain-containing protein n=1 Tax=Chitinophaga rhizosphaerae TaxID=1864947 RepID=UPI000F80B487|nr:helix-turn-helix transcriptional regulator [Chitinophaga rhizosphaerae]